MNLKQYYNKQVKIVSKSGKVFWGTVNDYFYPEDNDTVESLNVGIATSVVLSYARMRAAAD